MSLADMSLDLLPGFTRGEKCSELLGASFYQQKKLPEHTFEAGAVMYLVPFLE